MKIVLKAVPPSLNQFVGKQNGWKYRDLKARWTDAVKYVAWQYRTESSPEYALVHVTYYFPDAHRRDPDNYCGKLLLDGLTKAGIIRDDSFDHISLRVSGKVDKKNPRTEIEVEELCGYEN